MSIADMQEFRDVFDDLPNDQVICSSFSADSHGARVGHPWMAACRALKESMNLQMNPDTQMSNLIEIATVEFWIGQ